MSAALFVPMSLDAVRCLAEVFGKNTDGDALIINLKRFLRSFLVFILFLVYRFLRCQRWPSQAYGTMTKLLLLLFNYA